VSATKIISGIETFTSRISHLQKGGQCRAGFDAGVA